MPTKFNPFYGTLDLVNAASSVTGIGTGDFVGPAASTDSNFVIFSGTTGKLGKDSNISTASFLANTTGSLIGSNIVVSVSGSVLAATTISIPQSVATNANVIFAAVTATSFGSLNISSTNISCTLVTSTNLTATTVTSTTVTATNLNGLTATVTTLTASNLNGLTATVTTITSTNLNGLNVNAATATHTTLSGTTVTVTNLNGLTATVTTVTATNIGGLTATLTTVTSNNLNGNIVNVTTITAINIACTYLTATNFSGGGLTWSILTSSSTAVSKNGYLANSASNLTITLPATAAIGDTIRVSGMGAGGWTIAQIAGQQIHFGNLNSTAGVGGSLASTHTRDAIELVCCVLNSEYNLLSAQGNITIV